MVTNIHLLQYQFPTKQPSTISALAQVDHPLGVNHGLTIPGAEKACGDHPQGPPVPWKLPKLKQECFVCFMLAEKPHLGYQQNIFKCRIYLEYLKEDEDLTNLKMRILKINNRENGRRPERTIFRKCIRMICNKLNNLQTFN